MWIKMVIINNSTKSEFFSLLIMHHIVSAALIMTVFFGSSMIASAFRMHSRGSSSKLFQRRFLAVDMKNPQVYFGECEFANSIFSIEYCVLFKFYLFNIHFRY